MARSSGEVSQGIVRRKSRGVKKNRFEDDDEDD